MLATVALALMPAAQDTAPYRPPVQVASDEGELAIAGFRLAPGLRAELVAAEPHLANPVAFTVADRGRIFVVETFRLKHGVFDTRNYRHWLDDDLACRTVADRVALYEKHFGDVAPHRVHHERLKLLLDDDGDGHADRSTVFADQFGALEDGIAAGVLCDRGDVWYTCIPRLWRLRDEDGDGHAEVREAVHDGFGVHVSLIGHDMHGLCIGPDRRLYFSIGDRGFHVETEGRTLACPHEGAVLRCELDGSRLEVWHRGLRNPQELAFDAWGNLFTGDNNSDGGDAARWVQVVDGGHSGWCIGFQWLPSRGSWHRDRLWHTWHPTQAAWVLPPVAHIANGPSGLSYYPGTGLGGRYDDTFLLCDFRGTPALSGIWSLKFQPKGATFELVRQEKLIWNVLPTDVEHGPDGAVYLSDWVNGWEQTGKGRIYRVSAEREDPRAAHAEALLRSSFAERADDDLLALLGHADRRVRQEAQFALVDRGATRVAGLRAIATGPGTVLRRLHAVWGLGCIARLSDVPAALDALVPLLDDGDARIRTQAAKVLGDDGPCGAAFDRLRQLVTSDPCAQVRMQAALALGRIGRTDGGPALLRMLAQNGDADPYLRHAAVMGLARIADVPALLAAAADPDRSVRLGVLLALRRLERAEAARFLADPDPWLVAEAARAIYDVPIEAAMASLADQLARQDLNRDPLDEALCRRAVHANRYLGGARHASALGAFARRTDVPDAMRLEAIAALAEWHDPRGQDPVFGNWRPPLPRAEDATTALATALAELLGDPTPDVSAAAADAAASLRLAVLGPDLAKLARDAGRDPRPRDAALRALHAVGPLAAQALAASLGDEAPVELRKTAVAILAEHEPRQAAAVLASLVRDASTGERRNALDRLGGLRDAAADVLLLGWLAELRSGAWPPELELELLEAAAKRESPELAAALAELERERSAAGNLASYRDALYGGDAARGRSVFFEKDTTQCMRCHTVGGRGGAAAPVLDGVGARRDREFLLRSLIDPQADIAPGFATIVVATKAGATIGGFLKGEDDRSITIVDENDQEVRVAKADVADRTPAVSAMPPVTPLLTRRELRDVVEFLASLR